MLVYRIAKSQYINDLSGTGCLFEAGRWHILGSKIVYTSQTVSLAKLEILANANRIPIDSALATIQIPDRILIEKMESQNLPQNWNRTPYPDILAQITENWKKASKSAVLQVPSVHSHMEYNYLINPLHLDFKSIEIIKIEPAAFDGRFFK